ncbi:aminotransferase class IV family protein [Necropsobacter massiliensis]|uniref:aminotransferase class IV family protein n=1 Tax=Necropsobacter massiliensis TaxID=1400001 RepID=UPI0005963112|nr:aminotransferase class IV family protein [Necropsobacter massiliensis]
MYPLFETLCIEQGKIGNLAFHQLRYERSLAVFYGENAANIFDLAEIIKKSSALLPLVDEPLIRCRIDYNRDSYQIRAFAYQRKRYRTFQPVICDDIEYGLKYSDRRRLDELLRQKGDCDEIMIIKQGKVTDCSIGNLIFRRGGQWFTPDSPLLAGTQRAKLVAEKKIKVRSIFLQDLAQFEEIRLINALNGL